LEINILKIKGIKVYDMYSEEFIELTEQLRSIDLDAEQKKEIENVIIAKDFCGS
jgi:hypothetical protein